MASVDYQGNNPFDSDEDSGSGKGRNPFEDSDDENAPPLPPKDTSHPPLPPKSQPAPMLPSKTQSVDPAILARAQELKRREEEISRREATLEGREVILEERERELGNRRFPNWPRCRPLIYHDIAEDAPTPETRRLLRSAYYGWYFSLVCLFYNFVCMFAVLIATGSGQSIGDFVLSIVYILFLSPIWFMIYRLLYRGVRKSKSSLYILFWCFYLLQVLNMIFFCVGFPGAAAGGIFYMVSVFNDDQTAVGFMLLVSAIFWGINVAYSIWIFIASRIEYRRAGGLSKAKREVGQAAVDLAKSNPDLIREGASMAAREAAKHPDLVVKGAQAAAKHSQDHV